MARGKYTAAERSLHMLGILAGKSLDEINDVLRKDNMYVGLDEGQERYMPESSYVMVRDKYATAITGDTQDNDVWVRLWEHVTAPQSVGGLPK